MKKAELDPFLKEALSILNVIGVMKINDHKDYKDDIITRLEYVKSSKTTYPNPANLTLPKSS